MLFVKSLTLFVEKKKKKKGNRRRKWESFLCTLSLSVDVCNFHLQVLEMLTVLCKMRRLMRDTKKMNNLCEVHNLCETAM